MAKVPSIPKKNYRGFINPKFEILPQHYHESQHVHNLTQIFPPPSPDCFYGRTFLLGVGVGVVGVVGVVAVGYGIGYGIGYLCRRQGNGAQWRDPRETKETVVDYGAQKALTRTPIYVRVRELEESFFDRIDRAADLTIEQITALKVFLATIGRGIQTCLDACNTLKQILHLLCVFKVMPIRGKYGMILEILERIPVERTYQLKNLVEDLGKSVDCIMEGKIPTEYKRDATLHLDVFILHTKKGIDDAIAFKQHLKDDGGIRDLLVETYAETHTYVSNTNHLTNIFNLTRYIFVLNMTTDEAVNILTDMGQENDVDTQFRIVTVDTTDLGEAYLIPNVPIVRYWQFLKQDKDSFCYLNSLYRILVWGREMLQRQNLA